MTDERKTMFNLFAMFNYCLLCNYEFTDYDNIIYRTENIHKVK